MLIDLIHLEDASFCTSSLAAPLVEDGDYKQLKLLRFVSSICGGS